MTLDLLWHTTRVIFPEKMMFKNKKGVTKEGNPITKAGNLARRNKQYPVVFDTDKNATQVKVEYPKEMKPELRRSTRNKVPTDKYKAYVEQRKK